jgi:hypothetical protein
MIANGHIYIGYCSLSLLIDEKDESTMRYFRSANECSNKIWSSIGGGIIDDDNFIVAIILIDDRLKIVLIAVIFAIISSRHYDT